MVLNWIRKGLLMVLSASAILIITGAVSYAAVIPGQFVLVASGSNNGNHNNGNNNGGNNNNDNNNNGNNNGGNNNNDNNNGGNSGKSAQTTPEAPYAAVFPVVIVAAGWVFYRKKKSIAS